MRRLPIVCLCCLGLGCGRPTPVVPETEAEGASRVLAVAQELENSRKTKQAMDAYQQVIRYYPNSPEAKKAADRIQQTQHDAIQKASTRNRR